MAVALPLMLAAASTAASVASKISDAHAQEAAADADARMADQNKAIAAEQGNAREEAQRRQGVQYLGRQTAAAAQQGIDITSGSSLDAARQSSTNLELDAQTIRYQGLMQGFGFERQAALSRARSSSVAGAVPLGVANSILGAASSYYGMTRPTTMPGGYGYGGGFESGYPG